MPQDHISQKRAVYRIAGMERAIVRKDVVYRTTDAGPLTHGSLLSGRRLAAGARLPAVVLVAGYNDVGYEKMLGVKFKEMAMSISWGQLIAASGLVAIAYTNREPAADLDALLQHVRENAAALGIDERPHRRVGLLGQRAARAVARSMKHGRDVRSRCGALLYGYMLDLDGATGVAEAAAMFRFTNPNAGKSLDDLPQDVPLFIVARRPGAVPAPERLDRSLRREGADAEPADHAGEPRRGTALVRSAARQRRLAPDHPAGAGFPARLS